MADSKPVSLEEFLIDYFTEREVVQTLLTDASSPLNRVIKHTQAFVSRVRGRKPNSIAEALELALAERLATLYHYRLDVDFGGVDVAKNAHKSEAQLCREIDQIRGWIGRELSQKDELELVQEFVEFLDRAGVGYTWLREQENELKAAARTQSGRPHRRNTKTIEALEMRLKDPNLKWRELAKRLQYCPPEKGVDEVVCGERLRVNANRLKEFLKRLEMWPPFQIT